jgi:hypothetical protein
MPPPGPGLAPGRCCWPLLPAAAAAAQPAALAFTPPARPPARLPQACLQQQGSLLRQLEVIEEDFRATVASIVRVSSAAELDDALAQQQRLKEQQVRGPAAARAGGLWAGSGGASSAQLPGAACAVCGWPSRCRAPAGRHSPCPSQPRAQLQQLALEGQMGGMEASLSAKSQQRKRQRTEAMDRVRDWLQVNEPQEAAAQQPEAQAQQAAGGGDAPAAAAAADGAAD